MQFQIGARLFGRYTIDSVIGEGGFGIVYSASDEWESKRVAIKILTLASQANQEAKERFAKECSVLVTISHPNIVRVFHSETLAGNHILVMEYCLSSLRDRIRDEGPLPLSYAVQVTVSMSEALNVLHQRGIIHRDIKPSNMLVGQDGTIKLADLGIAHIPIEGEETFTPRGFQPGTLFYMSPEQVDATVAVDHRSDIYSLAVCLYEMLTCRWYLGPLPRSQHEIMGAIQKRQWIPICRLNPMIPRGLQEALSKALEKDPGARFGQVGEFCEALTTTEDAVKRAGFLETLLTRLIWKKKDGKPTSQAFLCSRGHTRPTFGCPACIEAIQAGEDMKNNLNE